MRHRRRRSFPLRPTTLGAVLAGALVAVLAGPAVAQSSSSGPTRDQAAQIPGQYIMLDPVWVPVHDVARDRFYSGGMLIRLEPAEGYRLDACYLVPRLIDGIVVSFFENPITRRDLQGKEPARKRIQEIIGSLTPDPVVNGISVFDQMPELDETSIKLSRACQ